MTTLIPIWPEVKGYQDSFITFDGCDRWEREKTVYGYTGGSVTDKALVATANAQPAMNVLKVQDEGLKKQT